MTANYLHPHFWDSDSVVELGLVGKLLWAAFIASHRGAMIPGLFIGYPGLFHYPMRPATAEETNLAFRGIVESGLAEYDDKFQIIRMPNADRYALTPNINQVIGWRQQWAKLPPSDIKVRHLETLRRLASHSQQSKFAFERYFGEIVPGDISTYYFSKRGIESRAGVTKARKRSRPEGSEGSDPSSDREGFEIPSGKISLLSPAAPAPLSENINERNLFIEEGSIGTGDPRSLELTLSGRVPETLSGRVSKGFPKPFREGFQEGFQSRVESDTCDGVSDERRTPKSDRNSAPNTAPNHAYDDDLEGLIDPRYHRGTRSGIRGLPGSDFGGAVTGASPSPERGVPARAEQGRRGGAVVPFPVPTAQRRLQRDGD